MIPIIFWILGCLVQMALPVYIKARKDRRVAIFLGIIWCLHMPFIFFDGWRVFGS